MAYYAVANGRNIGIYNNWDECLSVVKGFKNAVYKKFSERKEAEIFLGEQKNKNIEISYNKITDYFTYSDSCSCDSDKDTLITDYFVYTDGSCHNNGQEGASAGIGIYFGINDPRNVSKKISGKQTNNIAELTAIYQTYDIIKSDIINGKRITIVSDSEYAIKCLTSYGKKCFLDHWKKDIPNKELVRITYETYYKMHNVMFKHVKAHTTNKDIHSIGNFYADKLANDSLM